MARNHRSKTNKLTFLRQRFLESAVVKDARQGYISVEPFNLALDPDVLQLSSMCWAEHYHHQTNIDDVVAHGTTAKAAITALQQAGVEVVGLAILFEKQWQGGSAAIEQATGVKVHSLIKVEQLTEGGRVILDGEA